MRALLIILGILVILVIIGWIRFSNDGGDPTIQIDAEKAREDTAEVIDRTEEAIDNVRHGAAEPN